MGIFALPSVQLGYTFFYLPDVSESCDIMMWKKVWKKLFDLKIKRS